MQQDDLRDRVIRLFGSKDLHRTTLAMDDAGRRLSRFFLVQLGINTAFGVIIATGLYFIGLPSPLLWGTIAALMRFVPYIGSYIAAGIPILLAAAVDPGWSLMLWVAALFLLTEPIIGQVVEPMLYGRSAGLSPISVVISAIFWGWLMGAGRFDPFDSAHALPGRAGATRGATRISQCSFRGSACTHQGPELLPTGARRRP